MDQAEIPCEEEQSPLHIKRELDINIPYRVAFPSYMVQQSKDTPKTAIRTTNIEHLEPEEQEIPTENTPKTQIDVSSPRVPFLTHSQIMGMNQEDDDMVYSKSGLNNPLSEIPEEQTPSRSVKDSQFPMQSKVLSQDFNLDNMSMVNSQQMKFSKKSSDKDSVISRLEMENSRLKEELREQIKVLDIKLKELEKENYVLKKKCNQEKVKQIELQLETEYKITTINEQYQDLEEYYKKQIIQLKNELNTSKVQINILKDQQQGTQSQIQFSTQSQYSQLKQSYNLSQSFTEQSQKNVKDNALTNIQYDNIFSKVTSIVRLVDQQMDVKQKDVFDLLQWLFHKIKSITSLEEEEKMDEHRSLISSLKTELGEIKQIRGQLSKIYIDYDQFVNKKNEDNQKELKINELNLTIQIMKQEKLELLEMQQKQQSQIQQKEQIINELQQKLSNYYSYKDNLSQTDTLRKSSQFVRSLQTNSMVDLKVIKESLKQRQEVIKKTFKSQNSPQSRSHNPSPTLKFLNSPKNSNHASAAQQKQQQQENKNYFNRTSEFSVDNSSHHATSNNNSSHQNNEIIQKLVEQFRGNSAFAQKISNYSKKA